MTDGGYDAGYAATECFWGTDGASLVNAFLSTQRATGFKVLDIGCGEGKNANAFANAGAHVTAMGGSQASARMLGLPVDRMKITLFTMVGALMGLVGLILIARIGNARADGAIGLEFDAIAAVVIGGTALSGGTGSLVRTLVGVLFIGVLNNGLAILNVDFNTQQVIKGVLVIVVVLIDRWVRGAAR